MTSKPYYTDSYTTQFTAQVIRRTTVDDSPAVVLSETYFYPTSGGQPHDLGTIQQIAVRDVMVEDDTVYHILAEPLPTVDQVAAQVNWQRRFDHMQQHTGQHILSRVFEDLHDASTIGFHLTENSLTIDLDKGDFSAEGLAEVERRANEIVFANLSVKAWFPESEELASLPLRKISEKITGAVRVVAIGDFDVCACGGTHVAHTGEVGIIKIIRTERHKQGMRLEFRCGWRALMDYAEKNTLLLNLAESMTTGYQDLPPLVERLQADNKSLQKDLKSAQRQLLNHEAADTWQAADTHKDIHIITQLFENRPTADLNGLMQYYAKQARTIAVLGLIGEKAHLIVGRSDDINYDVVPLLRDMLEMLGTKSGGGRESLAQGGGFPARRDQMEPIFDYARQRLQREL